MLSGPTILISAVCALLAVLILDRKLVNPWLTSRIAARFEKMPSFRVPQVEPDFTAEQVQFKTSDGVQLFGSLWNADHDHSPGLILFFPEMTGSRWLAPFYCSALIRRGYSVLSVDFRGHGDSECQMGYSPLHWLSEYEMLDVAAALEFVESHPRLSTLPILAYGVSRGGVAALTTGGRYPKVRGVIADSAFSTLSTMRFFADRFADLFLPRWLYRMVPEWHVQRTIRCAVASSEKARNCRYVNLHDEVDGLESDRVLLISGAADTYITPEISASLTHMLGPDVRVWSVSEARHNQARNTATEEYDRRILEHVERCLLETTSAIPVEQTQVISVNAPV